MEPPEKRNANSNDRPPPCQAGSGINYETDEGEFQHWGSPAPDISPAQPYYNKYLENKSLIYQLVIVLCLQHWHLTHFAGLICATDAAGGLGNYFQPRRPDVFTTILANAIATICDSLESGSDIPDLGITRIFLLEEFRVCMERVVASVNKHSHG